MTLSPRRYTLARSMTAGLIVCDPIPQTVRTNHRQRSGPGIKEEGGGVGVANRAVSFPILRDFTELNTTFVAVQRQQRFDINKLRQSRLCLQAVCNVD